MFNRRTPVATLGAMSSHRSRSPAAIARMYPARSAWVILGHGPMSNASRAAAIALAMSSGPAAATWKYGCSVAESITSICEGVEGATHRPPMKNWSGWCNGAVRLPNGLAILSPLRCGRSRERPPRCALVNVPGCRATRCR